MEDGQTTTGLHQLLALWEALGTVGHQAAVIPVNLNLGHADLCHIVACGECELNVLCLGSACVEKQC